MTDTGKITILCVDDDIDMLKLMERFLTSGGHRVITADSGPKAVDIAGKIIPDLIFLDVVMPEMNGYQVCSDLQQNHKTSAVPIIFVTAMEDDQNKALAFSSGAVDYLVKPPRKETLLHKVKTHATTKTRWQKLDGGTQSHRKNLHCPDFLRFKEFLSSRLALSQQKYDLLRTILYPNVA